MITILVKKLVLALMTLSLAVSAYPQGDILASGHQNNRGLKDVFDELEDIRRVNIVYEPGIIAGKRVSVPENIAVGNLDMLLTDLLKPVGLAYRKLATDTYVIKTMRGKERLPEVSMDIPVSGKVVSVLDQTPLSGVNVIIQGTDTGTVTDQEGNFKISVPSEESVLVFSFVGFEPHEEQVGARTFLSITLFPNIQTLSEIVVTAVGIETEKSKLGYAVQNVDPDDVINSREVNLSSAMSGKVAGVQVITSSGSPGAAAAVRIRGSRSINGNNEPLYVIDGLPINNSTNDNNLAGVDVSNRAIDINPNDIEKITVLKGPAATVLYGSRAANGAIMISTKHGKLGKPVVTLNSSFGVSEVNKLPQKQREYAQGRPSGGAFIYQGPETGEINSWGPRISDLEFDGDPTYPYDRHGRLVPAGTGNGMPAIAYNEYDAFFIKGLTFDNNLSVTGGTETIKYYASIGSLEQSGTVPNATFSRTSVKTNLDFRLSKKLSAGVSANYIMSGGNRIQRGSNLSGVTAGLFRNTPTFDIGNGKTGKDAANDPDAYLLPNGAQRSYPGNTSYDNPFWVVNKVPYVDDVNRFIGSLNVNYEIFPWLDISYKIGQDYFSDTRDIAWDINSSSERAGKVNEYIQISNRLNSDLLFLISKEINSDLSLDATLGHNYFYTNSTTQLTEGTALSVPNFYNVKNASLILSNENTAREKLYGLFADFKFAYKNWIYVNLSARNDWASSLPDDNNSFFYPAASLGVEFTELLDLTETKLLSYGKLRFSYGQVGSAPPIYSTNTYFNVASVDGDDLLPTNDFPAFGVSAFERNELLGNSQLKPELTTTFEAGGDFIFLDGSLDLSLTYYKSFTDNQITTAAISAATGFTDITLNSGEIENRGWEIVISGTPLERGNFSWEASLNFSRNRSIVKSLPENIESIVLSSFSAISSRNIVGHPYGVLSGTRYRRNEAGQLIIGADGWPLIDNTQGVIGDPSPDWLAGLRNTFTYKDWTLSFLFDIKQGGVMWNGTKAFMDYLGVSKESGDQRNVTGYVFEGVTATGEPNTIPVDFANPAQGLSGIKWRKAGTSLGLAEDNIEDASWVRLREITLNYRLPSQWTSGIGISSLDLALYGRNLWLLTDYKGIDPETNLRGPDNGQGWDYFNLPGTRTYGVTLKATIK